MSTKKPAPRKRNRKPAAPEELRAAAAEKKPYPHQAPPATDTITAEQPTREQLEVENKRLREINEGLVHKLGQMRLRNDRLCNDIDARRRRATFLVACSKAFDLIQLLAIHHHRFERIEVRAAHEKINQRAVPYEATLVVTYPSGTRTATVIAADPARALLLGLAEFADEMKPSKEPPAEDIHELFDLLDNKWSGPPEPDAQLELKEPHEFALAR